MPVMSGSSRNRDDISSLPVYLTGEMGEGIPRLRFAFQRCRASGCDLGVPIRLCRTHPIAPMSSSLLVPSALGWAQHVAGVRKTDSVPTTMRLDNGSRPIVSLVAGPIALKFEQHLDPGRHSRSRRFHSSQCQFMTGGGQSATRIANNEHFVAFGKRRKHGK
jgi:hypothetical protein